MILANKNIQDEQATAEQVGNALLAVADAKKVPLHQEPVTQKIYVGPNLLGLSKYTVLENQLTPHIESFVKECPEIKKLIVPIGKMAETEARIKEKGTLENRHYNKILAAYSKRKGEE